MKKILSLAVCTALVANIAPLHIKANESGGDVQVSENGNRITIGNGYIKRVFENNNGNGRQFLLTTKELMSNLNRLRGQKILSLI